MQALNSRVVKPGTHGSRAAARSARPLPFMRAFSSVSAARRMHLYSAAAPDAETADTPEDAPEAAAAPAVKDKRRPLHYVLSDALLNLSITIVGDNTELNVAVAQQLGKQIGWFPVSTSKILLGMHKQSSVEDLEKHMGRDLLVKSEAEVLHGLRNQFRCCVATMGEGAAAQPANYNDLWGSFIIWVDEVDPRQPNKVSAGEPAFSQAELFIKIKKSHGFGSKQASVTDKAGDAAKQIVPAMCQVLLRDKDLVSKKKQYIERGCLGDWPPPAAEAAAQEGEQGSSISSSEGSLGSS